MGPKVRSLGKLVPGETLIWQDPVPAGKTLSDAEAAKLKADILATGASVQELVKAAWASASTYRRTDMRGGANGARVRLAPQSGWAANDPSELSATLSKLESLQSSGVSMADLIVLGGAAAVEKAAADAGVKVTVRVSTGRGDATADQTDADSFAVLEPKADAFRNYLSDGTSRDATEAMLDKAHLLGLTAPEMTVLVGGMRAMGANAAGSAHGVLTNRVGQLTNDFFVNLLDMGTEWTPAQAAHVFEGKDRASGTVKWTATNVDLIFGSHSQLRALAEVYGQSDAAEKMVHDFVAAWVKVMDADRFDLA